ncbi:hypothetical protein GCM10010404_81410 [Nonomuraea africana]|uniref:Uncharacterized protein n=1 Tax=Nonomuraea africana TaxID=46171 RepID=A0ABR9KXX5_9ACTN|nr:hypothetical protein [Nonomuraea africana]MBE1566625.1 hypothetical protein [Nonomuraea africana]
MEPDEDRAARAQAMLVQQQSGGWWLVLWAPYRRRFDGYYLGSSERGVFVEGRTAQEMGTLLMQAQLDLWRASLIPTQARLPTPQRPAGEVRQTPISDPGSSSRLREHQGTPERRSQGRGHHRRQPS